VYVGQQKKDSYLKEKGRNLNLKILYLSIIKNNKIMYSLDCMYYGVKFKCIGDLIAHIVISGMDPDYEITLNGKGIGQRAIELLP
jgi:argonaute-like protein implicated in RNA metabolism and viral defense